MCFALRKRFLRSQPRALAAALAQFGSAFALVYDAGFLEKAALAHFGQNAVALHQLVKAAQRALECLIIFNCHPCQCISPAFCLLTGDFVFAPILFSALKLCIKYIIWVL